MTPTQEIQQRIQYIGEIDARLAAVQARVKAFKHHLRRRDPEHAREEMIQLINDARRLALHMEAWGNYIKV